jgi:polar amino acid transport system substrate-binding protein
MERTFGAGLLWLCLFAMQATAEPIRITYNQPFPPFSEFRNGNSEGLAVDILHAAASRVGIVLQFVPALIDQMEQALKEGRTDALFLAVTPERRQSFDFSDPVLTTGGALFVRAPNATPESLIALSGKIVVTPQAGPLAASIRGTAPAVKLALTKDYEESLARVVGGEADAAALNYHAGTIIAGRLYRGQITMPRSLFREGALAVAVPAGQRADFLAHLNSGLAAIRSEGTWQKISNRWMGE